MSDLNQPELEDHPTVENAPHAVEDMGISNEDKINQLLATAITVRVELRDRIRKFFIGLIIAGVFIAAAIGAAGAILKGLNDHAVRLTKIATENRENGQVIREALGILVNATSDEATARARAATADAINEIRRSIDCTKLSDEATYPACVETVARLDAIRAGLDPFAR